MKPRLFPLLALSVTCGGCATAQTYPAPPSRAVYDPNARFTIPVPQATTLRTPAQLEQLLGPIALYPDALVALILPAATEPSDVVLAARYFNGGGDVAQIEAQPWEDSVKALAHYPDIVKWMDQNLAWTKQIGDAFLAQPAEVMNAAQRLRAAARAAGTLVDTPQQRVVYAGETIVIVPAQPDVIYVPYYDPEVVYVSRRSYYPGPYLTFSTGYQAGFWLGYDLDWERRRIWVINHPERERYWREEHRDWHRSTVQVSPAWEHDPMRHAWTPNPAYVRPGRSNYDRPANEVVRPAPATREPMRPSAPRGNMPHRPEYGPQEYAGPRAPAELHYVGSPRAENIPYGPAAPGPSPAQAQHPAPTMNRGGGGWSQPENRVRREAPANAAPVMGPVNRAPAPEPALTPPPVQPAMTSPQPAPSNARREIAPPAQPAPQVQPAPQPQPPPSNRGRRGGENEKQD